MAALALASAVAPGVGCAATTRDGKTSQTLVAPARRDVPGTTVSLPVGELYIPDYLHGAQTTSTDVMVFFHGAAWCARQNFHDARTSAVLVTVSFGSDYNAYRSTFSDPAALDRLLASVRDRVAENRGGTAPAIGRIGLSSFSGGYAAVREILRIPSHARRIECVLLADSLYARRDGPGSDTLNTDDMKPFEDYALRAANGECTMWFTHLYPPEERHRGNTTTLAANRLIGAARMTKMPSTGTNTRGAKLLYRAEKGNLHILGYAGMTTQDHFEHFYSIADLFRQFGGRPMIGAGNRGGKQRGNQ